MSQSSPMVLPEGGQQSLQLLSQQMIPSLQAIQITQTGRAPQTPTGSSARQDFTQQQIVNSQDTFNSCASILNQTPITSMLAIEQHSPAAVKLSRPSLTGGHAASAPVMSSPAIVKLPAFELNGSTARVLRKRKVSELLQDMVGISSSVDGVPLRGDERDANIDCDVEELLLDLADQFVISVASFSCRLAKHRKSNTLNVNDVKLHLERNWNIKIPGYNGDEIRSVRRWNPTQSYLQKLSGIKANRAISGK
ncbi:transcription initiation factor TFIID subunit A-domain-containing protein [Lipomyces chichibuensis]|uniref:transcription initiation factor TFIID subunit A-domain-containing protein n=1 Tax=Lipomyces chichibuensis TaxID=1546026 RepID=UPI0033438B24